MERWPTAGALREVTTKYEQLGIELAVIVTFLIRLNLSRSSLQNQDTGLNYLSVLNFHNVLNYYTNFDYAKSTLLSYPHHRFTELQYELHCSTYNSKAPL